MDIDGQGEGWTKCSGWPHRRVRRLTGFSTTWVGYGRRIGSGRAVGVRGGTLRGPGIWRSRRLVGGTSGWRGTCRRLRLGTVAPPKKMILLRLRRFGMWSGGVGRGRTRGGRLTGSRRRGGGRGPRSRASSDCLTRAGATSRCERRSATRSAKCCRGRCEDVANADTDDEQIVVNLSGASGGRRPCRQRRWLTSSLVETGSLNRGHRRNDAPANELDCKIVRAPDQTPETQREIERDAMSTDGRPRLGDMPYWPRMLSEEEAAAYVGLSVNTFRARTGTAPEMRDREPGRDEDR